MSNTYASSMRDHIIELEAELNGLNEILEKRELSQYEYRAIERTVQITIEASIGIAKHWCKKIDGKAPASAYQSFERLAEEQLIDQNEIKWKLIIGMRNVLVHDYLNVDREIVKHLIKSKKYQAIIDFSYLGLSKLDC
jgi:uncharacterized protein YutE (UPF0331/DUF86 family)